MNIPYKSIHVVINPASGKDQPILNVLNDVFHKYGVDWEISITKKYGDALQQAKDALGRGVDLVAGYGGDGTMHEIANALIGSNTPMGILPGGTGNGFANEMGIPTTLFNAVELLCTSPKISKVDAAQIGDQYFIQRMYAGIDPENQTTRAMKDKYGVLAYGISLKQQTLAEVEANFHLTIDGKQIDVKGIKCYVVNSGQTGSGLSIDREFSVTDGWLDVFVINRNINSLAAAADRFFQIPAYQSRLYYWRGQEISIQSEPSKAIWTDGEYYGRTPVNVQVLPGALAVVTL
jgi:diacylglycerol kinase (ATP)